MWAANTIDMQSVIKTLNIIENRLDTIETLARNSAELLLSIEKRFSLFIDYVMAAPNMEDDNANDICQ